MKTILDPFKKILDFIVYSNVFISICVVFFTLQTAIIFADNSDQILAFILPNFIATFVLYNLQRLYYAATQKDNPKYNWYNKNRRLIFTLIILAITCSFNLLWNFFFDNNPVLIGYACLVILSVFYFLPPLQLRKYGVLKPFIIAFVFVCTCIILPLISNLTIAILIYTIGQFCFIAALCVLFDIKDVKNDTELNLITLPIKYGLKKTKWIIVFLFFIYGVTAIYTINSNYLIAALITICFSILLTFLAKPNRHVYFYLFLVDGCIILQCLTLLFLTGG